jgi:hypothetical protein
LAEEVEDEGGQDQGGGGEHGGDAEDDQGALADTGVDVEA